jgi:hypothetical protein
MVETKIGINAVHHGLFSGLVCNQFFFCCLVIHITLIWSLLFHVIGLNVTQYGFWLFLFEMFYVGHFLHVWLVLVALWRHFSVGVGCLLACFHFQRPVVGAV